MKNELAHEIFTLIETRSQTRPTAMDFEMAYQARVAIDRIRFAIKHTSSYHIPSQCDKPVCSSWTRFIDFKSSIADSRRGADRH